MVLWDSGSSYARNRSRTVKNTPIQVNESGVFLRPFSPSKGLPPEHGSEGPKAQCFDLRLLGEVHALEEGLEAGVGAQVVHHDLRHEAGSRFLEAGWPLSHVREMLGHANISTTDTYLNAPLKGLQESMRRFDEGKVCKFLQEAPSEGLRPSSNNDTHATSNSLIN